MLKVYRLIDARRHIHRISTAATRRDAQLTKRGQSQDMTQTKSSMQDLSKQLQEAQNDLDSIDKILIALDTELYDPNNTSMVRMKRFAQAGKIKIEGQILQIESGLTALTTHYDSKLRVLLGDLERRFAKSYQTRYMVRAIEDREIGVLYIEQMKGSRSAFLAVLTEPMTLKDAAIQKIGTNQYKLFFNAIPIELSLENFQTFQSPSHVERDVRRLFQEEGF